MFACGSPRFTLRVLRVAAASRHNEDHCARRQLKNEILGTECSVDGIVPAGVKLAFSDFNSSDDDDGDDDAESPRCTSTSISAPPSFVYPILYRVPSPPSYLISSNPSSIFFMQPSIGNRKVAGRYAQGEGPLVSVRLQSSILGPETTI